MLTHNRMYVTCIQVLFPRQVVVNSLHPGGVYTQVALVRLVGIMLLVYALETHIPFIEYSTDTVGTGIMGKLVSFYYSCYWRKCCIFKVQCEITQYVQFYFF